MIPLSSLREIAVDTFKHYLNFHAPTLRVGTYYEADLEGGFKQTIKTMLSIIYETRFYLVGKAEVEQIWLTVREDAVLVDMLFEISNSLVYQINSYYFGLAVEVSGAARTYEDFVTDISAPIVNLMNNGCVADEDEIFLKSQDNLELIFLNNPWLVSLYVARMIGLSSEDLITEV